MTALPMLAGRAALAVQDAINRATTPDQLDGVARTMWGAVAEGAISDEEATFLQSCIDVRRPPGRNTGCAAGRTANARPGRVGTRFKPRQHPRSPDRKASRDRRRTLGGSAVMPPHLRQHYTEGQRAVLCIIAGEVKHHGLCDLPVDKIAALAGVCRTTVQTTLHEARRLGHVRITARPMPGRKHLPNVVEITSPEWRAWLKRGPTAHRPIGSNPVKRVSPTKSTGDLSCASVPVERSKEAVRRAPGAPPGPIDGGRRRHAG